MSMTQHRAVNLLKHRELFFILAKLFSDFIESVVNFVDDDIT